MTTQQEPPMADHRSANGRILGVVILAIVLVAVVAHLRHKSPTAVTSAACMKAWNAENDYQFYRRSLSSTLDVLQQSEAKIRPVAGSDPKLLAVLSDIVAYESLRGNADLHNADLTSDCFGL